MKFVFDIGGTNLRVARVTEDGITDEHKVPTPEMPEDGVKEMVAAITDIANGESIEALAGGIAGVITEDGTLELTPNLPQWQGFALGKELEVQLGCTAVIKNDADCAALGEVRYGAGHGEDIVAYIGVGTGIGGGRIVQGKIDDYAFGFEPGHQIIDVAEGESWESLASGGAVSKRFGMHPRDVPREEYDKLTPIFAAGLYNTIAHWSPNVLVLGGSMMNEDNGYRVADIQSALDALPKHFPLPELRRAKLGDAVGLHGARALLE